MPGAALGVLVRSSTRRALAAATCLTLASLTAGCIASTDTRSELHASEGSGGIVMQIVLTSGDLSQADAWWEEDAPQTALDLDRSQPVYHGLVLKNDVVVAEEPLSGSASNAVFTWTSSSSGTVAEPGDEFEVIVTDEDGATVATYELVIRP